MSWIATAIVASAAISTGYAVYSGEKQKNTIKKAQANQEAKDADALKAAQTAQETAESQAKEQIKERKRRMANSQTIFTSPLGLADQAKTARKTILGS